MKPTTVYELIDPRDGNCFYVGISDATDRREVEHRHGKGISVRERVRAIQQHGEQPVMKPIATYESREQASSAEKMIIDRKRHEGARLCNDHKNVLRPAGLRNHGSRWSDDDKRHVLTLYQAQKSCAEIAKIMGRSTSSIRHVLRTLGVDL